MTHALLAFSSIVALLWLPIGWRFFRAWRTRRNPVSLAVCTLVVFTIYTLGAGSWSVYTGIDHALVRWIFSIFSAIVCLYFYFAFKWSHARFKDERSKQ